MNQADKAKADALAEVLRGSANPEATALKDLVAILVGDAKDTLVAAEGDEILRSQGAVRALQKLHTMLTRQQPAIK